MIQAIEAEGAPCLWAVFAYTDDEWELVDGFEDEQGAQDCVADLRFQGYSVRIEAE